MTTMQYCWILAQIARIDALFAKASQEALEASWQADSELYQLDAERAYWVSKLPKHLRV